MSDGAYRGGDNNLDVVRRENEQLKKELELANREKALVNHEGRFQLEPFVRNHGSKFCVLGIAIAAMVTGNMDLLILLIFCL